MGDKMESEHSFTGESSSGSTSGSTTGTSEGDEEIMEAVRLLGFTMELPQELCENYAIFKEFFSMKTWNTLEDDHKDQLKQLLPKFTDNDEKEKKKTVEMLFNYEPFHFTTPLADFYDNLRQGNYRPDIARMRKFLKKARVKQQQHKIRSYYAKLLPEVLISRERLLAVARSAPPGPMPRISLLPLRPSAKSNYKSIYVRVRQRYFKELSAIRSEVGGEESDDDNYPEGLPEKGGKKKKQIDLPQIADGNISGTLGGSHASELTSLECLKIVLSTHRKRRQYRENHIELNTSGITLDDIKARVTLNGGKKLMFGGPKGDTAMQKLKRGPKKDTSQKQIKTSDAKSAGVKRKDEQLESVENRPLLPNIKIKCEQEESDSEASSFVDPVASPKLSKKFDQVEIKQEVVDTRYPNMNYNDPMMECVIKQEPQDPTIPVPNTSRIVQPVPIKLEDLDGIDMMALPIEIADDCGEVMQVDTSTEAGDETSDPDDALTETTHANFLSLVRALFPARSAHRLPKQQLHARCAAVMKSPIAPLNTWYSSSDDWCGELDSALSFLAGERGPHPDDFVPYLQFIPESQMYQWIGAGRDGDAILGRLCERWLRAASPPAAGDVLPPKYPTSWVVRAPTAAEVAEFRAQERRRFAAAAKPFTYQQFGYRSVVGPCARATISVAGHGALLVADRPRHASFLALVRDAVARLPNGEGTRHDVATLMRMSQWVAPCMEPALLGAVSAALERLQAAKRDPMVRCDQRTAVWTHLHRNRSEDDWIKPPRARGGKAAAPPPVPPPVPPLAPVSRVPLREPSLHTSPHAFDMEVAGVEEVVDNGSDTDVDVDDSGSPTVAPRLSSAQLLMQATQASAKQQKHTKVKRRLVPVSPNKAKNILTKPSQAKVKHAAKQGNTATQAAKSSLMSPPMKQANLTTQSVKQVRSPTPSTSKQVNVTQSSKQNPLMPQSVKQSNVTPQSTKQTPQSTKQAPQSTKQAPQSAKHSNVTPQSTTPTNVTPQSTKPTNVTSPSTKQTKVTPQSAKQTNVTSQSAKQSNVTSQSAKQSNATPESTKQTNVVPQSTIQSNVTQPSAKQLVNLTPPLVKLTPQLGKQSSLTLQSGKQAHLPPQSPLQSNLTPQSINQLILSPQSTKCSNVSPQLLKQFNLTPQSSKTSTVTSVKQSSLPQTPKLGSLIAQSAKQASVIAQLTKQTLAKQLNAPKQTTQAPKGGATKPNVALLGKPAPTAKPDVQPALPEQEAPIIDLVAKSVPPVVSTPHRSPLIKQRPLLKQIEPTQSQTPAPSIIVQHTVQPHVIQSTAATPIQVQIKQSAQGTRSLLIRPPAVQTTVTAAIATSATQVIPSQRRGVVRVLSPATQSSGKSLISPRALMQQGTPTTKKRTAAVETVTVTTVAQIVTNTTTVVSSVPTVMTPSVATRTVQLSGGRTVQLAANQTVHLPGGQAVQLTSGHTLQLSSLQLPTHSVRLPSGQTVQLASPQAVQAMKAASTASVKPPIPRTQQSSPTMKSQTSSIQIPISTVQLAGQTVQIGGQTVQLASQSVQLTGHTVKLPSGQSVQVASQSCLQPQSVQLPSGQTVHLTGNVQMGGQSVQTVQLGGQTVQLGAQTVQLGGQTVQLGGQTVQLGGQTVQLPSGQTVQLSTGQTLQLASGQTVQLANQLQKPIVRAQAPMDKTAQPIVAKLLTNAQGQMISLESAVSGARTLHMPGVRVLSPGTRMTRPLLLATGKPLQNIILQQSDGSAIRVTSAAGTPTSQIVLSTIGAQTVTTATTSAPVLKLQQTVPSAAAGAAGPSGVRSVLLDGQQLKLVSGRHVLARVLRAAHPPPR